MPQLDFQFLRSAVRLCATCFFNMSRIVVANERRGSGAAVDFFMGETGSVLVLQDSYRLRPACTTTGGGCFVSGGCVALVQWASQAQTLTLCGPACAC